MTLHPSYHSSPRRGPPLGARPPRGGAPNAPLAPLAFAAVRFSPTAPPRARAASVVFGALTPAALALAACLPNGPPTGLDDARPPTLATSAPAASAPAAPGADPPLEAAFEDDFARADLGPAWRPVGPGWLLRDGRLCGESNRNRGVWLARRLPPNARVEFDALAETSRGDLKAEFWGDGASGASGPSYRDATSYLLVFGGWNNRRHVLARLDEHDPARFELAVDPAAEGPPRGRVRPGRTYHVRIERAEGRKLTWHVDGALIASFDDPSPLSGPGHDHWGFNNWEGGVCFDNVRVLPLP